MRIVRFKKMRPRRGSLAVSISWGSPMAAKRRSAALAYRIGSPRQDSRYSAIDIVVSRRDSKERTKALNRESLYMIPSLFRWTVGQPDSRPLPWQHGARISALVPIGYWARRGGNTRK